MFLSDLGVALRMRFERTGDQTDVDAAIEVGRAAVDAVPADHPRRAMYLSNLGLALWARFERTGVELDLDAAIDASQAAVNAAPIDLPRRAVYLSNAGIALGARFDRTGSESDLDAAIAAGRAAVDAAPADHPRIPVYLSNLGLALRVRYERTGVRADIDAAVDANTAAVKATPVGHLQHVASLINFAGAVLVRFNRTGSLSDLDAAVDASTAAVNETPGDHPSQATMLTIQGVALRTRFERTGDQADLDAAVDASRAAVSATPSDHPYWAGRQHNLGVALRIQYERRGALTDLDAAIEAGRAAVEGAPNDDPHRAMYLSSLGIALHIRYERSRQSTDLDAAIVAGREAAGVEASSPRMRALGARGWGRSAGASGRWQEAVTGFEAASALLARVVPRSLARADQEHMLVDIAGLAADAAVCCLHAGLPERAVELFEQGRAVLLGQALDIRTDVTTLAEVNLDLARRFTELCREFDRVDEAAISTTSSLHEPGHTMILDPASSIRARERRERMMADFDQVITRIRTLPGFDGFLQPPVVVELQAAALDGPVVVVAVSIFGSHALILTRDGIDHVPLPGLTPQNVLHQAVTFLNSISGVGPMTEQKVEEILGWLWDALAEPVLDRLAIHGPPEDGTPWPRMWWCLSGLLSFLPVHAAGHHHTRFDPAPSTLIDRVVSSYTPTIRALAQARRVFTATAASTTTPADGNDPRMLAVAMSHTPAARALPGARDEAEGLQQRFGECVCVLLEGEATRDTVLAALPQTRWAHFACHGAAEINDPSNSRLLLHDQPLTVLDVARLRLDDAELAFLSACETARPGGRLTDEAIHLASAFQLAGYQHVIATLWPISDDYAVKITESIYSELADHGDVASAVHIATRDLRNYAARHPSIWASHVHVGAMNPTTLGVPV